MTIKLTVTKVPEPIKSKNQDGTETVFYPFLVKEIQRNQFDDGLFYSGKPIPEDAKTVTVDLYQKQEGNKMILKIRNMEFKA